MRPRSLYDQVIKPHEHELVWYSFRQKLPEVSPIEKPEDRPPGAEVPDRTPQTSDEVAPPAVPAEPAVPADPAAPAAATVPEPRGDPDPSSASPASPAS